jgi:sugar/nucleoside kinase (ribokinase family)
VHAPDGHERDFYIGQLRDGKGIAEPALMEPHMRAAFGEVCGTTLARAHARSGDRIAIGAYLGRSDVFDRAMVRFAESYAALNERDHQALLDSAKAGRVSAQAA